MKYTGLIISLFFTASLSAQHRSIVYFKDKPVIDGFELSRAASERRAKSNLTYDQTDLPVNPKYLEELPKHGAKVVRVSRWLNAALVEHRGTIHLNQMEGVLRVAPLHPRKADRVAESVDSPGTGVSDKNFNMHNGLDLRNAGYTGKGILIAVFDAGFNGVDTNKAFARLRDENRIVYKRDMIANGNVFQYDNHGAMVLSCMAAYLEGAYSGTAVDASYCLFVTEYAPTETQSEEFNWVAAAEIADSLGVQLINSSLGYTTFDDSQTDYEYQDMDGRTAISTKGAVMAARKGILVVNSAGNSRTKPWKYIGAPADADSILAVGAITIDSSLASFSSSGPTSDGRVKPEVAALGSSTSVINTSGNIANASGTSFAAPVMAGLCASLWQSEPQLTNMEIRQVVLESANQFANPDTNIGYGIPDFSKALKLAGKVRSDGKLKVYPNPINIGNLTLETGNISGEIVVSLLSSLGQELGKLSLVVKKNTEVSIASILPGNLPMGMYFLKIKYGPNEEERVLIHQ